MHHSDTHQTLSLMPLTGAWLTLIALTLASLFLGQWFHDTPVLQVLVAAIIWLKGFVIARHFLEIGTTHPFIRNVVLGFVAVTPLALIAISYFGSQVARWATL